MLFCCHEIFGRISISFAIILLHLAIPYFVFSARQNLIEIAFMTILWIYKYLRRLHSNSHSKRIACVFLFISIISFGVLWVLCSCSTQNISFMIYKPHSRQTTRSLAETVFAMINKNKRGEKNVKYYEWFWEICFKIRFTNILVINEITFMLLLFSWGCWRRWWQPRKQHN